MTVKINLKIFVFALIFYFTKQIHLYAMLMLFAFIHELGHLLCGLVMGLKPKSLKIMPFGICIEFSMIAKDYHHKRLDAKALAMRKIAIALAGPITNGIVVIVCNTLQNRIVGVDFTNIIYANVLIAVFNLLPIYPLDGGRCLHNVLKLIKGNKMAIQDTNWISNACLIFLTAISSIAILYYKNIAILFIICYLWYIVSLENKRYKTKMRIYCLIEESNTKEMIKQITKQESNHAI